MSSFLVPKYIADSMLTSCSIAAPDAGETEWVSAGTYALGDVRVRASTRKSFECVQAHTGVATAPEVDPTRWLERELYPMNRWALFDNYVSTPSTDSTTLEYVLRPGFINGLVAYGMVGSNVEVIYKDGPGGTVLWQLANTSLVEGAAGWWEYYYGDPQFKTRLVVRNLPLRPDPELTFRITGTGQVACGLLGVGSWRPLAQMLTSGPERGARAEPTTYSKIVTRSDGTSRILRGHRATNLRFSVALGDMDGDAALEAVREVLDIPAAWVVTDEPTMRGLNTFGLASASISYDNSKGRTMNVEVKGFI